VGNLRERENLEDVDVDAKITLKWVLKSGIGGMDWIDLTQYRNRWPNL
jgi:hypothetical protein